MVTARDVHEMLEGFGIKRSDKVTVHSALRSVGPIENGADGLIDAFCSYLTDGLLIIPTHTWADIGKRYFDVRTSVPCLGALSKVAAFREDGVRSLHPTHSVAAFGKGAAEYVKGEEKFDSPAPAECCLGRLYEENGKILLIGVGHEANTFLHTVDARLGIPNRMSDHYFEISIRKHDGTLIQSPPFHGFYSEGIPKGASEYYPNYKKPLEYCGAVTYGRLGDALVYCCDARKTVETVRMLWEKADYDLCECEREIPESYYKQ